MHAKGVHIAILAGESGVWCTYPVGIGVREVRVYQAISIDV